MKTIKTVCTLIVFLAIGIVADAQAKKDTTVIFKTDIHCPKCKAKVEQNMPFEKGVKDLKVNLKDSTILVSFKMEKNTIGGLKAALEKCDVKILGMCTNDGKLIKAKDCKRKSCCVKEKQSCEGNTTGSCDKTSDCKKNQDCSRGDKKKECCKDKK